MGNLQQRRVPFSVCAKRRILASRGARVLIAGRIGTGVGGVHVTVVCSEGTYTSINVSGGPTPESSIFNNPVAIRRAEPCGRANREAVKCSSRIRNRM